MARLMAKQPKRLGGPTKDEAQATELDKYVKLLRDYQNVVFAVVVLILTVGVLAVWAHQRGQEQEDAAWAELGKVQEKDLDKLYGRGESVDDLNKAHAVLERAQAEVRGNEILSGIIKDQLKGIDNELGDKKLWSIAPVTTQIK